jgi:hypothetical protein
MVLKKEAEAAGRRTAALRGIAYGIGCLGGDHASVGVEPVDAHGDLPAYEAGRGADRIGGERRGAAALVGKIAFIGGIVIGIAPHCFDGIIDQQDGEGGAQRRVGGTFPDTVTQRCPATEGSQPAEDRFSPCAIRADGDRGGGSAGSADDHLSRPCIASFKQYLVACFEGREQAVELGEGLERGGDRAGIGIIATGGREIIGRCVCL